MDAGGRRRALAVEPEAGLRHDNIAWEALETLGKKEVPKDCDALFVLGPQRAFSDAEAKLILDYVQKGGNALIALDPVIEHDEIQADRLRGRAQGRRCTPRPIAGDRTRARSICCRRARSSSWSREFGDHVTTRVLKDRARVVMALARSLSVTEHSDTIEVLLRTSDKRSARPTSRR